MNKKLRILLINHLYHSPFSFPFAQRLKLAGIMAIANAEDSTAQGEEQ